MTGDSILVLGIGNLLWADEGFGVRCVEALQAGWRLPEQVTVLDGGTQGLYLLPYVSVARHLIVFDAIDYGLAPGTLRVIEGDDVPRFMGAKKMSLHQTGFQEVLSSAMLLGALPESLCLIGVQPRELEDYGGSLRPEVRARVPEAIDLALARLRAWGVEAAPVAGADAASPLALDAYEAGRPDAAAACRTGDARFLARMAAGHPTTDAER
ncbi:HyaD/HybD family hydrogenase maturation endopeptidase [Nitrogeniibacter mangrovi]|uniref:HyaD/HybD family hydrogenase maturation endopeptidase n=1 Tax=Nitrogeniibacter mangrovi TaxID=2016596 RepID=UPI001E594561|nr:HyaD/HybD family hydrogenase maturation endopeptidase [Nitrogeniibacter mangrovi]